MKQKKEFLTLQVLWALSSSSILAQTAFHVASPPTIPLPALTCVRLFFESFGIFLTKLEACVENSESSVCAKYWSWVCALLDAEEWNPFS